MSHKVLGTDVKPGNGNRGSPTLSVWLEKRCKDEGLSYRKAAAMTGVSHATIAEIINGNRPSAATIVKLASAFSGNGQHQKAVLEDLLLSLCGYKSKQSEEEVSEPLGRLMDKVSHLNDAQLSIVEQFADFVAKIGDTPCLK